VDNKFDVIIIGAGAVGNAIADLLSDYNLSIAVLEKEADTAFGISGRNSGVVHAGFNNPPGFLKSKLCVQGAQGFPKLANELGIKYKKTGKLVVAKTEEEIEELKKLKVQGEENGVRGLSIIGPEKIEKINSKIKGLAALYSKNTAIFYPFEYTIALAKRAHSKGVEYNFNNQVICIEENENAETNRFAIKATTNRFLIKTQSENNDIKEYYSNWLINAAGLHSDEICRLLEIYDYEIVPKRGEYHILDKRFFTDLNMPVYPVPSHETGILGIHLTNTFYGNVLVGPSGENIAEKEDYATAMEVMDKLLEEGRNFHEEVKREYVIRSFSGVRPKLKLKDGKMLEDFVIKESKEHKGFIILTGIESPGITSSVPIAKMVLQIIKKSQKLDKRASLNMYKKASSDNHDKIMKSAKNETEEAILKDTFKTEYNHKNIICRCEQITEGEILKAYDEILSISAIPTLVGIKNRTRAGMGRCQGGFCQNRIINLLEKERGVNPESITLFNKDSIIVQGRIRQWKK
jgi:glycerol-3-phosphate dehydrogenase